MLVGELGGTLEESRVEVEDVSRVSLSSGRSSEKKGHLSVRDGLLGQIVEDDEGVLSVVSEPLSDGSSREGREVLKRGGLGSGSGDNDGVFHRVVLLESLYELGDGGSLLSDSDVDAVELGGLILSIVPSLLVEDGVDGDSGLTGLSITDDELSLTSTDGNHGVDRLESSQHGLGNGLSGKNSGSLDLRSSSLSSLDGTFSIDGVSESVNDSTKHSGSNWNIDNVSGSLDRISFLDQSIVTEDGDTDVV